MENKENDFFYKIPKKIFKMKIKKEITNTSFFIYVLFYERARISTYKTSDGYTFFYFTLDELKDKLNNNNRNTLSKSIKELEEVGLIKKINSFKKPTKFIII